MGAWLLEESRFSSVSAAFPCFSSPRDPWQGVGGEVSPRKHRCFTTCNSFSSPFDADTILDQTSRMTTVDATSATSATSRVTNNHSGCRVVVSSERGHLRLEYRCHRLVRVDLESNWWVFTLCRSHDGGGVNSVCNTCGLFC